MKINPSDRITMSKSPIEKINSTTGQISHFKPKGLWYGVGKSWINWVQSEEPQWMGKYIYKLTLTNSVLKLSSVSATRQFSKKFKADCPGLQCIDWQKVALEYSGIEIAPYQSSLRSSVLIPWYYTWDVASGCIWNVNAVQKFELVE